jgi:hypothetical protein
MSREVTVRSGLGFRFGGRQMYQSRRQQFYADLAVYKGPTVGALTVPVGGEVVHMNEVTQPGFYEITNLEPDGGNYVTYGLYDSLTGRFHPWGEIAPGEQYVGKFARELQVQYTGTGTGTTGDVDQVFLKANSAPVVVLLQVWEGSDE